MRKDHKSEIQPTTGKGPFLAPKHKSTDQSQIHQASETQVGGYMLSGVDRQTPAGGATPAGSIEGKNRRH
jgi:hypothetical protein